MYCNHAFFSSCVRHLLLFWLRLFCDFHRIYQRWHLIFTFLSLLLYRFGTIYRLFLFFLLKIWRFCWRNFYLEFVWMGCFLGFLVFGIDIFYVLDPFHSFPYPLLSLPSFYQIFFLSINLFYSLCFLRWRKFLKFIIMLWIVQITVVDIIICFPLFQ